MRLLRLSIVVAACVLLSACCSARSVTVHSSMASVCTKDQASFCEYCCCKHGNPDWRAYNLGAVDDRDSLVADNRTKHRYFISLIDREPQDCKECSRRYSCGIDECATFIPRNPGSMGQMGAMGQTAPASALQPVYAPESAEEPELNNGQETDSTVHIMHCCDVGMFRNEEGETIRCDYSG